MSELYVVFEGGGIEYDPLVHGIFADEASAKGCIKARLSEFLALVSEFSMPNQKPTVDKKVVKTPTTEYTYFYVYQDEAEVEFDGYINVFVLTKIL